MGNFRIPAKRLTVAWCRCAHTLPVRRGGCKAFRWADPTVGLGGLSLASSTRMPNHRSIAGVGAVLAVAIATLGGATAHAQTVFDSPPPAIVVPVAEARALFGLSLIHIS